MPISIPFSFSPSTKALSAQVNSNFTALGTAALNRTGDTMTGTITSQNVVPASSNTYDLGSASAFFNKLYLNAAAHGVVVGGGSSQLAVTAAGASQSVLMGQGASADPSFVVASLATDGRVSGEIKNFFEASQSLTISSNVLTVDFNSGNVGTFSFNANITTTTLSNIPASGKFASFTFVLTADGSVRTWAWLTGTVKWSGGTAPTFTSTNTKKDVFMVFTVDGGTNWYGVIVGQNY
jgi:hypothetical protein